VRRVATGLALALAVLGVASAGAQTRRAPVAAPAVEAPADVVDAFHGALKAGDRRKALEQLTADVLVFEQGRIERTRTEYARRHLGEDIGFASVTQRTVTRRSGKVQGDVAWVASVNRTRGTFKTQKVDFSTDETMILVRTGGKWRIAHIHWSFDDKAVH
jgi:ketosteroid isomerase-like protein